jgi:hypothetical protein
MPFVVIYGPRESRAPDERYGGTGEAVPIVCSHRFHTIIKRTVHNLQLAIDDVPVQDVQFQSRR